MSKSSIEDVKAKLQDKIRHHLSMVESLERALETVTGIDEMLNGPRTVMTDNSGPIPTKSRGPRGSYTTRKRKTSWGRIIRKMIQEEGEMNRGYIMERLQSSFGYKPNKKNKRVVYKALENLHRNQGLRIIKHKEDQTRDMFSVV